MEWQPIETAPKDGQLITLCWFDGEDGPFDTCSMMWGHIQRNGLFPGKIGMWVSSNGAVTWNDDGDGGPTHWMPLPAPPVTS